MNMYKWQEDIIKGLATGDAMPIIVTGRQTGKSRIAQIYMEREARFRGAWKDWEKVWVWPFHSKRSSISNKRIWGDIRVRTNRIVWNGGGAEQEYATKKEVFVKTLKDGGQGW